MTQVQSSCSCTTAEGLEGRVIGPGQGADMPVTLKTGADDGPRSGSLTLYYRAAGRKEAPVHFLEARVAAHVNPDYRVRPTILDFGTVDHLNPLTRTVRLRPEALPGVAINSLSSSHDAFTARQVATPPGGEHDLYAEVTFSGRPLWKSGPVNATVHLNTNSVAAPTAQILTRARFVAPVEVEPASVVIGSEVPGRVTREVRLSASQSVRIAAVRSSDPRIRLAHPGPSRGRDHRVVLTIDAAPGGAINSEVSLDVLPISGTVAAEARTVSIPVHRLATKE